MISPCARPLGLFALAAAVVTAGPVACGEGVDAEEAPREGMMRETIDPKTTPQQEQPLPEPRRVGGASLEEALARRRSVRAFADAPLTQADIGQLAWAAQGITDDEGHRAAPSAGALYPLELYVGTAEGLFHYDPRHHSLVRHLEGDPRPALQAAGLGQEAIGQAPVVFIISAVYERTEAKYGARSPRYVHMEAGHAAQNILLQAVGLGLGAVPMGAFDDERLARALSLSGEERPLYLIPVGRLEP